MGPFRLVATSCKYTVDCVNTERDMKFPISLQKCKCLSQVIVDLQHSLARPR